MLIICSDIMHIFFFHENENSYNYLLICQFFVWAYVYNQLNRIKQISFSPRTFVMKITKILSLSVLGPVTWTCTKLHGRLFTMATKMICGLREILLVCGQSRLNRTNKISSEHVYSCRIRLSYEVVFGSPIIQGCPFIF